MYDEFSAGAVEREQADSLANIAGKFLKAEQLQLARDIFKAEYERRLPQEPPRAPRKLREANK